MGIEELRQLIEEKKVEARGLLDKDLEKAEKLTQEVRELQKKLDLALELEEEEKRDLEKQKKENRNNKKEINEFRAMTKMVLGQNLDKEERAIVKIADNSAVVPKEFLNELEELRNGFGSLKELCHIIPVTSESGSKPVVDLEQGGNELPIVLEGSDIEDDSLATTSIDYKVDKIGKLVKLSSELVDDAVIDIENIAKTVFLEKATRAENARILNIINKNAKDITLTDSDDVDYKIFAKTMDEQVPAVKSGLITLVNSKMYSEWKNAEDKQGRNLNLITAIGDKEYFNGKPIVVFDDSLVKLTSEKTKVAYMVNMKEAVKFFDRKQVTIAKAEKFENDTKMIRILERIDVKTGSTRSIKKLES